MIRQQNAASTIFLRYLITNMLILLAPFLVALLYYLVSADSIERAVNSVAELQLEESVSDIDRKLQDIEEQSESLMFDYKVIRYLNNSGPFTGIELYNMLDISKRLSTMVLSTEILSRAFIFLAGSDMVIFDNGYSSYSLFYGTVFDVENMSASEWKNLMTTNGYGDFELVPGYYSATVGKYNLSHFYIRQIGRGEANRGTFVVDINAEELARQLAKLPDQYGGWVMAADSEGRLVASTSGEDSDLLPDLYKNSYDLNSTKANGQTYNIYRHISSHSGWTFIAFMNKARINAAVIRVRNLAFLLLAAGAVVSLLLAYFAAFSNTKPLRQLFSFLKNPEATPIKAKGVYLEVEEAILKLSDSKKELEKEFSSAIATTRAYFLQNLLQGEYRDRAFFSEDRNKFRIALASSHYFVIVFHISPLLLSLDSGQQDESFSYILKILSKCIMSDEYVIRTYSGALAAVLRTRKPNQYKNDAEKYVKKFFDRLDPGYRGAIHTGVGKPVSDPFLLPISYGEAEAANAAIGPEQRTPLCYYEDLPTSLLHYHYPLHEEEAIVRAIKSANRELLNSLLNVIRTENFIDKSLSPQEGRNLTLALRGTALRILSDLPEDMDKFSTQLGKQTDSTGAAKAFNNISEILRSMADERGKGKHSHNEKLSSSIREYVSSKYRDFNLSLASIAETFNISESYLSTFFKEQEGETLSSFIQRKRMAEASSLLISEKGIPIKTIAANCGYPNTSSFRRAFNRVYGISPSEYRSKNTLIMQDGMINE